MAILRYGMDIMLIKDLHLGIMADFAATDNMVFPKKISFLSGYGIELGYNSIIGPIRAGVMYGSYNNEVHYSPVKTYISIGYNF